MRNFLKDPLTHFLVGGALLFAGYQYFATDPAGDVGDGTIVVNRPALLEFIQYRSKAFDPTVAARTLDSMDERERSDLIADYVKEQALYREAKALGLDTNDYVIKRRMIQTLEFVVGSAGDPDTVSTEAELEAYYDAHQDAYGAPPEVTFTHVFLATDGQREEAVLQGAQNLRARLNGEKVPFTDAPRFGDRFVYNLNYVDQREDTVAGHFGTEFAARLMALEPDKIRWQGPVRSAYGYHLVLLTGKTPARMPPLAEIRSRVESDLRADRAEASREAVLGKIVSGYEVRVDLDKPGTVEAAAR